MKSSSFYVIQGWMINELHLKGNELLIFSVIYGFSKDGQGKFEGSLKYLCYVSGASRTTVINTLNNLLEKEYILKEVITVNNIQFCKYFQNELVVQNLYRGSTVLEQVGSTKTVPNNILINNIDNKDENFLFSESNSFVDDIINKIPKKEKKESTRAILFSDSDWFNYENLRDYLGKDKDFVKKYAGVDLRFYISKAEMWSENNPSKKRTNKGWLLTLRDWMRTALENRELKLLKDFIEVKEKGGYKNH